jgi:hypothetical protein
VILWLEGNSRAEARRSKCNLCFAQRVCMDYAIALYG